MADTNHNNKKIILASGSAWRLKILNQMFITPDYVITTDVPEPIIKKEKPRDMSIRLAKAKGEKAYEMVMSDPNIDKHSIIIAGDTVACIGNRVLDKALNKDDVAGDTVACIGNRVLDKALNKDDVRRYTELMNGRNSRIYSTACIIDVETGRRSIKTAEARVRMKYLQQDEIDFIVDMAEGIGKAGGYSIGGFACCLFDKIVGSYTAILGLDAPHVYNALRSFGYRFEKKDK